MYNLRFVKEENKMSENKNIDAVVYFAQCEGFIKIGQGRKHNFEGKLGSIMSELQRGNPFLIKFRASINFKSEEAAKAHERDLHERFKHLCHRGEWFRKEPELLDYIEEHAEPYKQDIN